jgi:hypothetical protein
VPNETFVRSSCRAFEHPPKLGYHVTPSCRIKPSATQAQLDSRSEQGASESRPPFQREAGGRSNPAALSYFDIGPSRDHIGLTAQNKMKVIVEHRVGQAIDPKNPGEKLQSISHSAPSVLAGLACERIFTTQKRAAYASLYRVKRLHFRRVVDFMARLAWHGFRPYGR